MNESEQKIKSPELRIFILQAVTVLIIIVVVLVSQFFGGSFFDELRNWYIIRFESNTTVNEVTDLSDTQTASVIAVSVPLMTATKDIGVNSFKMPLESGKITSSCGYRVNPITQLSEIHSGTDIAADSGSAIFAVCSGTVKVAKSSATYGNYIIIEHGGGLETRYAHCRRLLCNEGDTVQAGQIIAEVGSTGRSTGPHLHFEIRVNGTVVDAESVMNFNEFQIFRN